MQTEEGALTGFSGNDLFDETPDFLARPGIYAAAIMADNLYRVRAVFCHVFEFLPVEIRKMGGKIFARAGTIENDRAIEHGCRFHAAEKAIDDVLAVSAFGEPGAKRRNGGKGMLGGFNQFRIRPGHGLEKERAGTDHPPLPVEQNACVECALRLLGSKEIFRQVFRDVAVFYFDSAGDGRVSAFGKTDYRDRSVAEIRREIPIFRRSFKRYWILQKKTSNGTDAGGFNAEPGGRSIGVIPENRAIPPFHRRNEQRAAQTRLAEHQSLENAERMLGAHLVHETSTVKKGSAECAVAQKKNGHPVRMHGFESFDENRICNRCGNHNTREYTGSNHWTQGMKIFTLDFNIMTAETNVLTKGPKVILNRAALPMFALTLPIVFEQIFRVLISSIDTIMLSTYSQQSVAAVGMVSQYIFFIQILFNVICIGTSIVLSQYLGANRSEDVKHVAQGSAVMTLVVAVVIAIGVVFGAKPLLSLYDIEPAVKTFAWQFMTIYGGAGAIFMAFSMLQGTILRAYGYTRDAMYIAIAVNVINVIGNSFALFGWFGLPVMGVVGVAISSTIAQCAGCFLLAWRIRLHPDIKFPLRGWKKVPRTIYRTILSVGVPTAGENCSYNVAQIIIMAMVSTLGTGAMSAMVYTQTIVRFVYVVAMSIGNAVQIKTGYFVGAKQPEAAYKRLYRYQIVGTAVSVGMILVINLFKTPLIGLFTRDVEIATLTSTLLFFSIYIETGRSLNLVTIPGLKGAGDVKFPVLYGIFSMWCIMVAGSYFLGLRAGWGLIGIWLSIGTDETLRGVVMLFRWKSKRWMTKAIA